MRRLACCLAAAMLLGGCKKEKGVEATPVPGPPARLPETGAKQPEAKPYPLTKEKLEAYLGYQKKMIEVYAAVLEDIRRMAAQADAGKYQGSAGGRVAMQEVTLAAKRRAAAEQEARLQADLGEEEVDQIGLMVNEVVSKRTMARSMSMDPLLQQMEELKAASTPEQKEGLEKSIAELKHQRQALEGLSEERARFGSANVDLLLSREEELSRNWEALLSRAGGPRR